MSEQNELVDFQPQKATKPMIEDVIPECLDGEMRENALAFVAWLRTNKMKLVWSAWQTWRANYKSKIICTIRLPFPPCKNTWGITPQLDYIKGYEELIISEGLQNIFLDNITYCVFSSGQSGIGCNQNNPCFGGEIRTIFGKKIKYVCRDSPTKFIRFIDPSEMTIGGIKRLLALEQKTREEKKFSKENSEQEDAQLFEQNEKSLYKEYKNIDLKSKIEDVAAEFLEGEKLKNALEFFAWLRANNISIKPIPWGYGSSWGAGFKGKSVCDINMGDRGFVIGSWGIFPIGGINDESLFSDEHLKEIVWANVKTCKNCSNCGLSSPSIIFGKEFKRPCRTGFRLCNLDAEEIECAKKLILARISGL